MLLCTSYITEVGGVHWLSDSKVVPTGSLTVGSALEFVCTDFKAEAELWARILKQIRQ